MTDTFAAPFSGGFVGHMRESESPFIDQIWHGVAKQSGVHITAADGVFDLGVIKRGQNKSLVVSGPTLKALPMRYEADDEVISIRLATGVYVSNLSTARLLNRHLTLPSVGRSTLWFGSQVVSLPSFATAENFVDLLIKREILRRDPVVERVTNGEAVDRSCRTIQRHFQAATGISAYQIFQIRRAEYARNLLKSGLSLVEIAHEAGYSHQGHMTTALKYLLGYTPKELRKQTK